MGWPIDLPEAGTLVVAIIGVVVVITLLVALWLLIRLVSAWRLVRRSDMPTGGKVAFWAALIYTVSPVDLLPDPIVLDDIVALLGALAYIQNLAAGHGLVRPSTPGPVPPRGRAPEVIEVEEVDRTDRS
ncbi:MAG: YkvA family protein [Acidimicrobiales bacterium]